MNVGRAAKTWIRAWKLIATFENWDELPEGGFLIDISCGPRDGLSFDGLWWTGEKKTTVDFNYRGRGQGRITVIFKRSSYEGFPVLRSERNQFITYVRLPLLEELRRVEAQEDDSGFCMPLHEFMNMVQSKQGAIGA